MLVGEFGQEIPRDKDLELLKPVWNLLHDRKLLLYVLNPADPDFLFEVLIPLSWRNFPGIRQSAVFVYHLRFDDTEYLLRVDVSAFRACALRLVGRINDIAEVKHRFNWIPVLNLKTSHIQDDEGVEHLEDIR